MARAYGLDAQALATLFQMQPFLGVDQQGSLLFACEGLAVGRAEQCRAGVSDAGEVQDAMTPNSSVTVLAKAFSHRAAQSGAHGSGIGQRYFRPGAAPRGVFERRFR